jgi:hypothetical protein|tara:strand:- start:1127 stop:1915 length:789 start_codon:yes stop_codon:yes gene_type:complete
MNNIYDIISDLDLSNGETKRIDCPACKGYKTFTATNNMGKLVWNCYKVNCSISGNTRVHLTGDDIRKSFNYTDKDSKNVAFKLPEYVVGHAKEVLPFRDKYELDEDSVELYYDVKEHRVVFPVVHDSDIKDAVGRALGKRLPKWKRYGNSDLPYRNGYGSVAVVVEDCVSAAVVGSDVYVGVAVLGTSLSESHKRYLSQFSTAIVALDPDALPKTLQFVKELRGYVNEVRAMKLVDDLKYRNPTDLENLDQHRRLTNGTITR